ncbi:MAG: hypothetical protein K2R98_04640 [Gemmataceae bacterium]|nr:hypothetical protein [Gemmataceae bacterium]
MAKNVDVKQLLIQKGERLGLGVATTIMLLLVGMGAVAGLSSASPGETAEDIKTKAARIQNTLQTGPAFSPLEIDPALKGELSNAPIDVQRYYANNITSFIETSFEDKKRNNPVVLAPVEFQADVKLAQVKDYLVSIQAEKVRVGILIPKDGKGDKDKMDMQKYAQKRWMDQQYKMPNQAAAMYSQQAKTWQALQQQQQPGGEFAVTQDLKLDFVDAGKIPTGARLAETVHPYRMVIIHASFPYKAQLEAFCRALKERDVNALVNSKTEELMPRFLRFDVRRRTLDANGKVKEDWAKLDLEKDYMPVLSSATSYSVLEPNEAVLGQWVVFPGLVMPRPKLARGEYPRVRLPLVDESVKKLVERTTSGQTGPVASPLERRLGGKDVDIFGDQEMQNADDVKGGPNKFGPKPFGPKGGDDPKGDPTDPKQQDALVPDHCLVRFVDVTVQPGLTYQYQVQIKIANPNYKKPADIVAYPDLATIKELVSEWAPKDPKALSVSVAQDQYLWKENDPNAATVGISKELFCYATDHEQMQKNLEDVTRIVAPDKLKNLRPNAIYSDKDVVPIQMHRWLLKARLNDNATSEVPVGDWSIADVPAKRGEYIGRTETVDLPIWFPSKEGFEFAIPLLPPVKPNPLMRPPPPPRGIPVDFSPRSDPDLLVDFEGGKVQQSFKHPTNEKQTKEARDDAAVELLVMAPDGTLRVLNSKLDAENAARKERVREWRMLLKDTKEKKKVGGADPFPPKK